MGQRESRSLRNGNEVAVEALDAFQRDYSMPMGRFESCSAQESTCSPTSRTLLVYEPPRIASQAHRDSSKPTSSAESAPSKAEQRMSSNASRAARRTANGKTGGRVCSYCSPATCLRCHHEVLKRQSERELARLDQLHLACCTGAFLPQSTDRRSLPWQLSAVASNERLAESAGLSPDERIASSGKQWNFYDTGGARERARKLARRHHNQLVAAERPRHLAAPSGAAGTDLARADADRESVARPHPSRRPAAMERAQQSSVSSSSSVASTLTLVSGASSSPAPDCLFTSIPIKSALQPVAGQIAADRHAASDQDASSANSNETTTPTTQPTDRAASTTLSPDQLTDGTLNNVSDRPASTRAEISGLRKTQALTGLSVGQTSAGEDIGIKSSANSICEPRAGQSQQQIGSSRSRERSRQQAVEGDEPRPPVEQEQVWPRARVTRLAWNELALKYGCKMSRKTSKQPIVSKTPDERPQVHSYGGISPPAGRPLEASPSRSSCLCHLLCALLQTLFPIFGSFNNYSLPGDLLTDLFAGFTVAVLHIPQGMAYGLLSGVEPIYGLYVSFVPVLVLSLMSKSRHVSYGTFAVISMLLVNTVDNVRDALSRDLGPANVSEPNSLPLVLTDNHQATGALKRLVPAVPTASPLMDAAGLSESVSIASEAASSLVLEPPSSIEILACACLVVGLVHISMSLMRLGVLSLIFSDQLVSSFTTASAIHVFTSQIGSLFDLKLAHVHEELFKIFRIWRNFGQALLFEGFNSTTALLSLCSIVFLLLIKQLVEPALRRRSKRLICLPSELVLMTVAILSSSYFKFAANYNVKIIGHVPTGLPEARSPRLELVPYVWKDSITIALLSYVMNLSIGQVYAKRYRYELEPNQELFALGTANIVGSLFSCFPCASSLSRSSVQSSLNVRSQLCSLFSCGLVVLIICFFAHILHDLPRSTLSCIILVALKGILMQVRDLLDNWRQSKLDALVWIITFVSVIVFGVTHGLVMGILSSLSLLFLRLLTPNHSILGRLPDTDIYVDASAFAECEQLERVKIFRFSSALCYLNRTQLKSRIQKLLPTIYKRHGFSAICAQFHQRGPIEQADSGSVNFLIIDCSALSYCDYSGAATLVELIEDLENEKVAVYLAACPLQLIDMLTKINSSNRILSENVYATISDAMSHVRYLLSSSETSSDKKPSSFGTQARQVPSPSQSCDKSQQTIINLS